MFNPTGWVESGKTRLADIKINGETLQTGYNYYTSCTGKGDTLAFTGLKSDADGVLTVEVPPTQTRPPLCRSASSWYPVRSRPRSPRQKPKPRSSRIP